LRGLDQQELNRIFQASVRWVREISEAKAMEATSDDKQVSSIKVLRIFIIPGWGMYFRTRRYEFRIGRMAIFDKPRSSRPPLHHIDTDILTSLNNNPFNTVRTLSYVLQISSSTVYDHLQNVLCFNSFDCQYMQ
jgi:hypothetical protein